MTREEVYMSIASKACNQHFYRRLLGWIDEVDEETANEFLDRFADCKDVGDVLMLMEG